MNKIYKVIWSKVKNQYVVVSELAHSNGKQSRTSRNSIRSRIAALVVCGAIAAFGVFSALPNSAFAAGAGAITTSGQYIAVAVDPDSGNDKYWDGRKDRWVYYKLNDTRTFTDAQDKTHTYTFVNVGGKNYWVREGYTITIEEGSRFTAYDQSGDVIAPEDGSFIIDSQKSPDADDAGLISSSEVVLAENEHRQTNSGALVDVSAGIYGGAVNSGGTEVKSRYNYYINDNNSGWKDVGNKENISGMGNYFRQVFRQSDGTYRTATGITVSTDNLYVIDGKLGAFFNSNNSVYTGNVYGLHNEVLMTGVDSVNGNYYSYWGTKINDPNMSMSNMTIGEHDKIVDGLQTNIDHVNGDIVQEIKLDGNTAGQGGTYQDGKGGTINLERRGYWNGTEFVDTGSVDGGITISSEGGAGGKDVAIKFANEDGSFTVDAGSKVEGKTENGGNALTGLSINGEDYTIAAGGKSVTRSRVNDNGTITVYQGEDDQTGVTTENAIHDYALDSQEKTASDGSVTLTGKDRYGTDTFNVKIDGLVTEDNLGEQIKAKNNLTVTEGATSGADGGNWQIEDSKQPGKIFKNTTLVSKEITPPTSGYENTYDISDTDGNTVTLKDVASATKLSSVDSKVGDTQYTSTNYIANGQNLTTAASNLDSAIKGNENKIGALDGRVVNVENDTITGGSIDTDGKINLRQNDGTSITTDNAIHDWKVTDANLDENGTLTLNTENAYGGDTGEVTVNNVASRGYVTNQIDANNTTITQQYENYFNTNDKYLSGATFDNNSGELKLTVAKAGENGAAQEYSFDLGKYVEGKDVYVNQISIDKDNNKLILNRKNATPLELGLEELSDIGVSSTDYQLVANPTNGSGGKYTVDDNGNLTLTVEDKNNPGNTEDITITGLAKKTDVAVIHDQYKDGEYTNLRDTKAQIWDETAGASDKKSSSIALGKDAFVSVQNGRKGKAILFGSDTYTGGIAIGQDSKALNGTVNIGVKDYTGKMGDVIVGDPNNRDLDNGEYNTYTAMGVGETSIGSNSYISGSLSTNIGSYNITTTKYGNTSGILGSLYSAQNFGSVIVGTLNSIESNSSSAGMTSGVANSVIGMANKTQNSNGSLVFGTGNEITNSTASIPSPSSVSGDVADVAENFRDSVSDRNKSNGGAVLAIGGGNKADYAQNSQLIGVQNEVTGTSKDISEFNMVNGYQNTVTNGSNDTVIGTKNTVTNSDSNVVLGDNHAVQDANNNVILGSSDKETTHTASDTVVIGHNAQANSNNDVAIGSGSVANGAVGTAGYAGANPIGTVSVGSEGNERTITNVAAGRINEDSTDAVNGSQLYATNQNVTNLTTKVDAGWSLYSNGKEVKNVKPGNNLVNIDSGENVSITKNEDGNGITISADLKDLDVEDTNAVLYDNEGKTSVTLGGTGHEAVKLTNVAAGALTETSTDAVNGSQLFETNTKVDAGWSLYSNGKEVKNVKPGNNWISIDSGDNVSITKNEDGNGIKISADLKDLDVEDTNAVLYDDEGKTTVTLGGEGHEAVKLTNVAAGTVNATSTDAINGSQLYEVQQQAGKHTTVTVNGGMTAPEDGSYTHDEEGRLDGNLLLKKTDNNGQTEYDLKLNPDLTLQGEDGSTARVEIGGTNGTIMATKDPNSMTATTTIDGGNVYVGSSVSVGDKVVMTDKDITGLSNTTWDGTTDNASRAATEGQLQAVSNEAGKHTTVTVNGGMTAPEDGSYTHDEEGRLDGNLLLKKTDNNGQTEYDLKLNPDLTLQGEDGSTARVEIGGTNGTIMATKDPNSMTATTTIDGGNVYVGSSVSVGDKVVMTDKDITGLSNTTWDGTTDDESRAATEGQLKTVSDTVNAGWTATDSNGNSIVVNPENESTLNFAGDRNIDVKANEKDGSIDVSLKDDIVLGGKEDTSRVEIGGTNGTIMATKDPNNMAATTTIDGGNVYVGSSISVGDKVEITDKDITGLSNTSWNGTTDDESRAATEGQLKDVSDTVNAGWTATDSNGASIVVNPENGSILNFAGDRNIDVKANKDNKSIDVSLSDDVVLGGKEGTSRVEIGGTNGTIMATKDPNSMAATTTIDGGNIYAGNSISVGANDDVVITDKDITGLSNTTWDGSTNDISRAATEGQLKAVSDTVNAGWIATDSQNNEVNITPDNNKLNFAGDENVTVTAANNEIKVALKDDIVLGDYLNGDDGVLIGGSSGTISATNSITVGEDQGLIIDGQKKEIQGLSNTTWNEKIANDAAVEGSTAASTAATQGQLQEVSKVANAGWTASDGTNSISVKPNETLNFVGDENLTVSADGTDKELKVALKDDITLKGDSSSIELTGTKGTIQVNQETAEGTNFTNINGNVVSIGYTNSEGIENAIVIDGGKGTITGLSNTTWDDELATQVANSEELQGTAATQGQLQQAVSAVATEAAKQHTTVSGDDNLTVKSSVNENGGTNYQVTLDDDITLGNPKAGNTEGERSFTINTTAPEGYVPDSYKEENSSGAEFIKENGGFMLFATDTQGHGIFGVTAKGSAWAKDFKTYTTDIYGNNTQYSLNDVGDAVAQMSSYYNKENGKSYTVFSRYLNEAEKDNPFATVDENATRDIPLALRDDGAVLIGATIKGDDFTDNGIRINAETETTYDGDGNEVTNNIATITGLENTEWKPPTPVATFAANDINTTSRAATEAQLDDLYSAVAAYDVNVDGTIDYSHIALAGAPYGASRAGNGTPTGGTSITNVAYASGKDGSEAVNVDYLNDAISDAAENGSISTSDQHLVANTETGSNGVYKPNDDGNVNLIVSDEKGNSSTITIGDVASKTELDSLKTNVGDLSYSKVQGDDVKDGDSVTTAIGKLDNKIENISGTATDADNNTVTGGKINSDGTISLTQKDKDSIKLEGQLTDSGVVQEGTSFDKETGTITITSQDKYSGETSSVKVEGIASTEVVGATNKEDLATAYKDADKDGNATTEYITDSESMVEADVALDHAIQDVAGTSYANDMVLSNRIDSVEKRLGNVEERIDKVGAMAAAIANLRTMGFDPEAPTEIAIGVGQYKSETGIAIGVFHYPNQDFMLSASLSSSGDELMGGIGATWKLGRKSAAERAKDEEARHLEQAEEMKKLAQQEKVKAQAQRHAKLLAERQQASQKNA